MNRDLQLEKKRAFVQTDLERRPGYAGRDLDKRPTFVERDLETSSSDDDTTATYCNTLQHTVQLTATYCNILQHKRPTFVERDLETSSSDDFAELYSRLDVAGVQLVRIRAMTRSCVCCDVLTDAQ